MVDDIRKKLDKATCELLESFIPFDKDRVMKFQTGLHAIYGAEKDLENSQKTNLYAISDDSVLEKLLEEHGVSKDDFDKIPSILKSFENGEVNAFETLTQLPDLLKEAVRNVNEQNRETYEVPASGMIAVTLNLINNEAKDALIAGQAGERSLQAIERILGFSMRNDNERENFYSSTKLSGAYLGSIGNEPSYLKAARATNYLADLLEEAIIRNPKITENNSIKNSIEAFRYLIQQIFLQSSDKLKSHGVDTASASFNDIANYLAGKNQASFDNNSAIDAIKQGLDLVRNIFNDEQTLTSEESMYFEDIIRKSLGELTDMEPV